MPTLPNSTIADTLESFASLLDLSGASFYTSRAYRRAAELVSPGARHVRVHDHDGPGHVLEERGQCLTLAAGRVAHEHIAERRARCAHVLQHRPRDFRIAEPRFPVQSVRDDESGHPPRD